MIALDPLQIQLGLPAYAKIFQGTEDMQAGNPYFKKTMPLTAPANDKKGSVRAGFWDTQKKDECDAFRDYASTYQYGDLFIDEPAQKATEADPATGAVAMPAYAGTKAFLSNPEKGANGWEYSFDDCTQSPMLYNKDTKQFITYDNPRSIKAKAAFAKAQGLKGIRMFNTHGDCTWLAECSRHTPDCETDALCPIYRQGRAQRRRSRWLGGLKLSIMFDHMAFLLQLALLCRVYPFLTHFYHSPD